MKTVPAVGLLKLMAEAVAPLQYVTLPTELTTGLGLTRIVNVCGVPAQPFAEATTVMVAVMGAVVLFIAVKELMFPVPAVPNPISAVLV
ncbi:hypothetical protein GCM10023187_57140 [Nibrella viscosa]|uniref:Uncharacterized protein n=1 Tax=Nibrella viscosa TaxID=1084524 RepID=A0ABP8L3C4_9BACT